MSDFEDQFGPFGWPQILTSFGQSVTVHPPAGDDRPVTALVDYEPDEGLGADSFGGSIRIEVEMANSAVEGISAAEFEPMRFGITLPPRAGDSTTTRRTVAKILEQNETSVRFGIR